MLYLSDSRGDDDPGVQRLLCTLEEALTLPELMLAAWALARGLDRHLIASVLAERARRPTSWPCCPQCGAGMRREGLVQCRGISLLGPLRWQRRVGRCPQGGETPQVAPLDDALGVHYQQRTSRAIQHLGWALAVFVPFATAAHSWAGQGGGGGAPRAVWEWVQVAGQRAMEQLHQQLQAAAEGHLPPEEPLAVEVAAMPLALGADGVMVPCRPEGGHPRGKTAWHEVKVGVLARSHTRTGKRVARLHQRRLVAVFGDLDALQRRLWPAGLRQGIRHASQVVWLSDGARGLWRLFEGYFTDDAP